MSTACKNLKAGSDVRKRCEFLVKKKRIPVARIDAGERFVDFSKVVPQSSTHNPKFSLVKNTRGNKSLEKREVDEYALAMLEGEHTYKATTRHGTTTLTYKIKGMKQFHPPWLLTDFDPQTKGDATVADKVRKGVDAEKKGVASKNVRAGTKAYNEKLTYALVKWVVRSKSKKGLGIIPVNIPPNQVKQERSALQLLTSKNPKAHCTELSYLLYEACRIAGLKPVFMLVHRKYDGTESLAHYCVGVRLDPAKPNDITVIDLTHRKQPVGTPHKVVVRLPRTTMLGIYHNNRASVKFNHIKLSKMSLATKKFIGASLLRAVGYDSTFPMFGYNAAVYYMNVMGDAKKAKTNLDATLKHYPQFGSALGRKNTWFPSSRSVGFPF